MLLQTINIKLLDKQFPTKHNLDSHFLNTSFKPPGDSALKKKHFYSLIQKTVLIFIGRIEICNNCMIGDFSCLRYNYI